jgi:ABC-2 type transport system ATP-binding protein
MSELNVVTVRGLRKSYGGRTVVDGLDLDVRAGEVVGLIGANGAGKTTTVECIQGLRRPDAGSLRVLGLDPVAQASRLRPLIGSQLQDSALPSRLRVAEAVELFATQGGSAGRRGAGDRPSGGVRAGHASVAGSWRAGAASVRAGDRLLEQFGLAGRRRSAFASLSGGERQRLFLVLALLNRPRLVILDELTQGLDPAARRDVWEAVGQLRDADTTVLLVTHEVDEAEALCDRVVVMREGRILDSGPPAELVDRHGRRAVIRFSLPGEHSLAAVIGLLRALPGVTDVEPATIGQAGTCVTVRGDRRSIAYVGAALVQLGQVPADLTVEVPDLENALLDLLDAAALTSAA